MAKWLMCGAILLASGTAFADYKKGDVVDLTPTLKGRVTADQTPNKSTVSVEIYQNPDNKPTGAVQLKYIYKVGSTDFSVESLAANAFSNNRDITSITLNNAGITSIPSRAFNACTKLTKFDFTGIKYVNEQAFMDSGITEAVMKDVWTIGNQAFAYCNSLSKVEVGEGCRIIGGMAFGLCSNLKEAILHYGLTEIGVNNFSFSLELADFVLPYTVTSITNDLTANSSLSRLFILSPNFKKYCHPEEEGKAPVGFSLIDHSALKEVYTLDELVDDVNSLLATSERANSIKAKSVSEFVEVVPVIGEEGKFTIVKHDEDIHFVEVYKSNGTDRIYADNNGVFTTTDGKIQLVYTVDKINELRYQVEINNDYPVSDDQVVKMYGDIFTGSWDDSDMTREEGLWVKKDVTVKTGEFLIKIFENADATTPIYVKSVNAEGNVVIDGDNAGATDGSNWKINKGTYTFTFNPATYVLNVTGEVDNTPDPDPVWKYTLHGNIENGSDWKDIDMTEADGVWSVTVSDIAGGQFGIKSYDTANEKNGPWISSVKTEEEGPVAVVIGEEMNAASTDNVNWSIGEGSYTFNYNPETNTLLVTKEGEDPVEEPDYYLVGDFNDWTNSEESKFTKGENGEYTFEIEELTGEFKITDGILNDGEWNVAYGSNGEPIELGTAYICSSDNAGNLSFSVPVANAKFVFVPDTKTLTITGEPVQEITHEYVYVICGKETAEGEWIDYPMEDNDGKWSLTLDEGFVEFYIKQYDNAISTEEPTGVIKSAVECNIEEQGAYPTTVDGEFNWTSTLVEKATYIFDPEEMTMTVDGSTGILSIEEDGSEAVYFNLQGQRVVNPGKGIYIRVVNGNAVKVTK